MEHEQLFKHLAKLPQRILALDGVENLTNFVLHDLCSEQCFNLSKAAYFIDNPDFDCFKGIGGYARDEKHDAEDLKWEKPELFNAHLANCSFNKKVRSISKNSRKNFLKNNEHFKDIASDLDFKNPNFYSWNMKHDNHGLFIFESASNDIISDELLSSVCVLGFCPIF